MAGGDGKSGGVRKRNPRGEADSANNRNANKSLVSVSGANAWTRAAKVCGKSRRIVLLLLPVVYLCVFLLGPCAVCGMRDTWHAAWAGSVPSGTGFTRGGTRFDSFDGVVVSGSTVAAKLEVKPNAEGEAVAVRPNAKDDIVVVMGGGGGGGGGAGGGEGQNSGGDRGKEDTIGREIVITSNMQVLEEFKVADKLTIRGHPKLCRNWKCSINANAVTRLFHVYEGGSLTLINLAITRGFSHLNGGAVYVEAGGRLNATAVTFSRNSVWDGSGGAVYVARGATASFSNCLFIANSAIRGQGGAVYVGLGAQATVKGCAFGKNAAKLSPKRDIYAARGASVSVQFCPESKPQTAGIGDIKFEEMPQGTCVKWLSQSTLGVRKVDNMARVGEAR